VHSSKIRVQRNEATDLESEPEVHSPTTTEQRDHDTMEEPEPEVHSQTNEIESLRKNNERVFLIGTLIAIIGSLLMSYVVNAMTGDKYLTVNTGTASEVTYYIVSAFTCGLSLVPTILIQIFLYVKFNDLRFNQWKFYALELGVALLHPLFCFGTVAILFPCGGYYC
jgi:hypothetical protein